MNLLPVVKEETSFNVIHKSKILGDEWLDTFFADLAEENPLILTFLLGFLEETSEEAKITVLIAVSVVYSLLKSQSEADKMNEIFI